MRAGGIFRRRSKKFSIARAYLPRDHGFAPEFAGIRVARLMPFLHAYLGATGLARSVSRRRRMTRLPSLMLVLLVSVTCTADAQDEPRPGASYEKVTLAAEPRAITRGVEVANRFLGDDSEREDGFYAAAGRLITGAGWISVGPGYRRRLFNDRAVVDASAEISWRAYKQAQAQFELPELANGRLRLGTQAGWQDLTQVNYFGIGPQSTADTRSEYRIKTTDVVGYASYRPAQWLSIAASGGRLDAPTLSSPTGPFDRDYPDARLTFAGDRTFALPRQPAFGHARASITADSRDCPDHPSRGGLYQASWAHYVDLDLDAFSFDQYEAEAAQFVPMLDDLVVFAVHGWAVFSGTNDGHTVPVYLMPSVGGSHMLRAFDNYRFHDRNMVVGTAEARVALTMHIDTALFVDAGSVAPTVDHLKLANTSYGIGLRVHSHTSTMARVDAAHGRDGWRLTFSLSDPLRLRRLERRMALVPFAP
jgi:hypothetical protein